MCFITKKNTLSAPYTSSDVEILISTMNQTNFGFLQKMLKNVAFEALNIVIINQTKPNLLLISTSKNIKVINDFGIGLSRSRNEALKNSTKKILVFTDDDVVYKSNFMATILQAFNKYTDAAVIQFQIEDFDGIIYRKYKVDEKLNLSKFESSNSMSIELVMKRSFLIEKKIQYDALFGLGAVFELGEENILLSDILSKKGVMHFLPLTIAYHQSQISADLIENKKRYFYLGAFYARQFASNYILWVAIKLFFDYKHKKITINDLLPLFKAALTGKKEYEKHR